MELRFNCTACGKCCFGWLPLTIVDAIAHADRFPLALVWTPVRQGSKFFPLTSRLGATVQLQKNKQIAVRVSPTAYIPPTLPCPELTADGLCGIHADKPSRCRSMPFSPYQEEADQATLLVPRSGWACDVSETAPVVYRDKQIVDRGDFDRERDEVLAQATTLRAYATWLLEAKPVLQQELSKAALNPSGGHVVVAFSTLIPRLPQVNMFDFMRKQLPVMTDFAAKTAGISGLADYHKHYQDCAAEMRRMLRPRSAASS
jgi:Fe-S-cluster containining protein